jgi:transcriptional regulator with XRE-family HTH domain
VATTEETRQRRRKSAAFLKGAMRAVDYVRPDGEPDVPALSRMSGIADNVIRRWLQEAGDPSLDNLRLIAPALGMPLRELVIGVGLMSADEIGLDADPAPPAPPPTPEERIWADDILTDQEKEALIHMLHTLRERRTTTEEPRRRRQA